MIYMDHNATTPVQPEVLEAMLPFLRERFGNPSSIHWAGRDVKGAVEEARERVARLVNCDPSEVVFTSGGTEANNTAIKGIASALRARGNHIITTRVEHPAVANACQFLAHGGYEVTWLEVDGNGLPDPGALEAAITPATTLISVMAANNETGVIMPLAELGAIAARHRVYFHCDGVQAAGKIPIDCRGQNIQLLSLSGHKLYAPKGSGALVVRKGVKLHPLLHGGAQERNRRAGTENVPAIVAFGAACDLARAGLEAEALRLGELRRRLERGIAAVAPEAVLVGAEAPRLPNTATFCFPGMAADSLLLNLDLEGIAVSSGSACSSGTLKNSPVLSAMGLPPELAKGALRFSLGRGNSEADIDRLVEVLPGILARLRAGA
jgi:cysteine desulfurase